MTKGKRIILPVTNEELKIEFDKGVSTTDLARKYNCSSNVIYRRLLEKDRMHKLNMENITGYEIISINDAMQITGLSRFILTKHMKNGELPCKRIGNRYMFQLRDIYKMVGINIDTVEKNKFTEMDILKENQETSDSIDTTVKLLVNEVKNLKQSVRNENKEAYDNEIINALKIINESQNKMNENILKINNENTKINNELKNIKTDIDILNHNNTPKNIDVKPIKSKMPQPLDKFGGA